MYRKMIKYTDFNGNDHEEPFYFNLTEAEVIMWQGSMSGGLGGLLQKATEKTDTPTLIKIFEEIICRSYGERSADGKNFRKSEQILDDFKSSMAYNNLFMELASNDQTASDFVNSILPPGLLEAAEKAMKERESTGQQPDEEKAVPAPITSEQNSTIRPLQPVRQ